METIEVICSDQDGPSNRTQAQATTNDIVVVVDATPITPTRPITIDAPAALGRRRSLRARKPSERTRIADEDNGDEIHADGEATEIEAPKKNSRPGRPTNVTKTKSPGDSLAAAVAQLLRLTEGTGKQNETILQLVRQNETKVALLEERIGQAAQQYEEVVQKYEGLIQNYESTTQKYQSKIEELVQIGQKNESRVMALEAQNQSMMDLIKNSANEQVKITRSWAQVVAGAAAPSNSAPMAPASRPSLSSGSLNPHSSASQPSTVARSAILIDLGRTSERMADFTQLKDKINEALKQHESTKEVTCTGVQRRAGGEDQVKVSFTSEEMAQSARQHNQWLQEGRFRDSRMLGDQWHPVKVDRVHRATLSPDGGVMISKEATEAVAQENDVKIERIRWLSKASDKMYGSVVVYFSHHRDAEMFLARGVMDIGGEMAYTRPYEKRQVPTRCFKCHQYGHQESRCKATQVVCGKCAQAGHPAQECISDRVRCAACQGPHPATDRACPRYMEILRRINPVGHHG